MPDKQLSDRDQRILKVKNELKYLIKSVNPSLKEFIAEVSCDSVI